MRRRNFLKTTFTGLLGCGWLAAQGCRGHQYGHVLDEQQADMVGSHEAGSEIYGLLIDEAVAELLGQCGTPYQTVGHAETLPAPRRVCFVGVENQSSEPLGDFKDQIYQLIDSRIVQADMFQPISRRYVDAAMRETELRVGDLFLPKHQRELTATLERQGHPLDYLLFATVTSGTTENNKSYQRDYLLTLEMVDVHTGRPIKASKMLRKGYHKSRLGKFRLYNPLSKR